MNRPRRPAQLTEAQIEELSGGPDPAQLSDVAHTSAQAFVPSNSAYAPDADVVDRIRDLARTEGVDVIAESWAKSPEDTLPSILWRGFLLREWIRREGAEVVSRFAAATTVNPDVEGVPSPEQVRKGWDDLFDFGGGETFSRLLAESASLLEFLATVEPVWIDSDEHDLANIVTRRSDALAATAEELKRGAVAYLEGTLD